LIEREVGVCATGTSAQSKSSSKSKSTAVGVQDKRQIEPKALKIEPEARAPQPLTPHTRAPQPLTPHTVTHETVAQETGTASEAGGVTVLERDTHTHTHTHVTVTERSNLEAPHVTAHSTQVTQEGVGGGISEIPRGGAGNDMTTKSKGFNIMSPPEGFDDPELQCHDPDLARTLNFAPLLPEAKTAMRTPHTAASVRCSGNDAFAR